jgi:hypothetical protein
MAKRETLKGGVIGFTLASAVSVVAHRFWPLYRSMTLPGKFMLISMATAGYAGFRGEHSLYQATRAPQVPLASSMAVVSWPEWIEKHRLEITTGTLAGALWASWMYFKRNSDRTSAQKFMSMRLFTQGLVLCTVLGIVGLTAITSTGDKKEPNG